VELTRYIHLNPVRARIVKSPEQFKYSSYCQYLGLEKSNLLNLGLLLDQFNSNNRKKAILQYRNFVEEGMANNLRNPLDDLKAGFILGSEIFYQSIAKKIDGAQLSDEMPALSIRNGNIDIDCIKEIILKEYHIREQDLFKKRGNSELLKLVMYLARTFTDMPISKIAKEMGDRHYSIVSHFVKQTEEEIKRDNGFAGFVRDIEGRIRANSQFKT
jgi:putative transposase